MAAKHSSSPSAAGAMRASLVLVLLLSAVAAAHGRSVSCENQCSKPVVVNGVTVAAGATVDVVVGVDAKLVVAVTDRDGAKHEGSMPCPADVTALVLVYEDLRLKVKVKAVVFISKLLHTVLYAVLGFIECVL